MPNWCLGSRVPCRPCDVEAMATAKTWPSYLKEPRWVAWLPAEGRIGIKLSHMR